MRAGAAAAEDARPVLTEPKYANVAVAQSLDAAIGLTRSEHAEPGRARAAHRAPGIALSEQRCAGSARGGFDSAEDGELRSGCCGSEADVAIELEECGAAQRLGAGPQREVSGRARSLHAFVFVGRSLRQDNRSERQRE